MNGYSCNPIVLYSRLDRVMHPNTCVSSWNLVPPDTVGEGMDSENVVHVCADVRLIFGADVMAEDKAS